MATQRRPAQGAKTATTKRAAAASSTRAAPAPASKDNKNLMIAGGVGGGLLVIVLIAVAMSGGKKSEGKKKEEAKAEQPRQKPKDVTGARRSCEEGYKIIQDCRSLIEKSSLTEAEQSTLKKNLTRGKELISEGNSILSDAGEPVDSKHIEALKVARMKLGELK